MKIIILYHTRAICTTKTHISSLIFEVEMYTKSFICLGNYIVFTITETKD